MMTSLGYSLEPPDRPHRDACPLGDRPDRWYACSFCDHVRGYGQPYIFRGQHGVLNRCPECLRFAKRHHDCTCELLVPDDCPYCGRPGDACICP